MNIPALAKPVFGQISASRKLGFEFDDSLNASSYMLQIDNLDYQQVSRHQGPHKNTIMRNYSTGFYLKNRIPSPMRSEELVLASCIPFNAFRLNSEESLQLVDEMRRL